MAEQDGTDSGDPASVDLSAAPGPRDAFDAVLHEAIAAPGAPHHALAPGDVLAGHYVIERVLGSGGMGTVYLARDTALDRGVALKLHHGAGGEHRLQREAIAMAKLAHPNVVTVFEVGELDGRPFVAMEYVRGTTLRAWLDTERSRRDIVAALVAAGEGLAAAHDAGLIHRDVKPDNIFVGDDGRVRIGDFGLAKTARGADEPVLTPIGTRSVLVGTPAYMAPEQIEGRVVDARTDQFAFCVAAWEALAGARPFAGATTGELREAIERGELQSGARRVPARIRRVLARGMAADPYARWPSLRRVLEKLRAAERRPRVIAALAAGAVAAGAATAWIAWPAADPAAACATDAAALADELPATAVDAAIATVRAAGRPTASEQIALIERAAQRRRDDHRIVATAICAAAARGQWSAALVAAGRECLADTAETARALVTAAAAAEPSSVVQIVTRLPPLNPCMDPTLLAAWRPLAADPAQRAQLGAARAQLDAAAILASHYQIAAARRIHAAISSSEIRTHPAIALRLDHVRGALAHHEGRLAEAEPLLADVYLRARAANDGPVTLATAIELIDLTGRDRRDAAAAERWIRDGLAEAERQRAALPGEVFALRLAAALVRDSVGDTAGALALLDDSEPLARGDDARLASIALVRSHALASLGRTREAIAGAEAAIEAHRALLGRNHPRIAELLAEHAALLLEAGERPRALATATEAMAILDGMRGESTTVIATAELNLGVALLGANDPAAAEPHLARARQIWVERVGPDHPDVALVDLNLAIIYSDRGELARALALLRGATAIQERALGPDHDELAAGLYNLAEVERKIGKLDEADATAQRSAAIFARRQSGSLRHGLALAQVAMIQNLRKQFAAALATAEAVLALPGDGSAAANGAWARLEAARALLALRRDRARARTLLDEARAGYADLHMTERVAEIDRMIERMNDGMNGGVRGAPR